MANLNEIREYLRNNGFRWDAYINGCAVTVDSTSLPYTFHALTMADAEAIVAYDCGGRCPRHLIAGADYYTHEGAGAA